MKVFFRLDVSEISVIEIKFCCSKLLRRSELLKTIIFMFKSNHICLKIFWIAWLLAWLLLWLLLDFCFDFWLLCWLLLDFCFDFWLFCLTFALTSDFLAWLLTFWLDFWNHWFVTFDWLFDLDSLWKYIEAWLDTMMAGYHEYSIG